RVANRGLGCQSPVIPHRYPLITEYYRWGRDLYINNTDLSPVCSCTLLCIALHSTASGKHSQSTQ
ncbi:unnamed protein product, partial [Staurois parvus]